MNKYSIITAVAIIVIAVPVLYGLWGIYAVGQIQLGSTNEEFSYFEMANNEEIKICNTTPFYVTFNGLMIEVYYQDDMKGVFEIAPATLDPNSSTISKINFSSESFSESQYLFMHMDGQFDGEVPIRLDPNEMVIVKNFDMRIIGIIPYQTTVTYSAFDFTNMMNENSLCD
ncbi:MAG: thr operon leader peptide [Nitrosopumilaceae archaeon]